MCSDQCHKEHTQVEEVKRYRLADFFNQHWDTYTQSPAEYITPEQYKAVAAIRVCRTEALGVDHYVCPDCGEITQVYHSCKHRFCPTCSWKETLAWADKLKDELLPIAHRHVIFTLPHGLNALIKANKWLLFDILFKSAAESIKDWMMAKYQLTPGIISVLHTFGEKKNAHFHIHMIVSWGGLDGAGELKPIKGAYINYGFMQKKFRTKFEDQLFKLFDDDVLDHRYKQRMDFQRMVRRINNKNWQIDFEEPMAIPALVIRYIGRYTKRACLSEYKITRMEGEYITFKYKDYKNVDYHGKPIVKELTLHYREFFPLLLQHVPLPYFRLVRYYGVYSARSKGVLKEKLNELTPAEEPQMQEVEEIPANQNVCKHCGVVKVYLYSTFIKKEGERVCMSKFNLKKINDKLKNVAA